MADGAAPGHEATPADRPAHASHDRLLIAALAAADLAADEEARATALVADCPDCARLAADLGALSRAIAELPAPPRPRDFSLRPADAARLRPTGWRRLARAFGGPRLDLLRPLSLGLTTLGIAGLLVSTLATLPLGQSAAAPAAGGAYQRESAHDLAAEGASPAASAVAAPEASGPPAPAPSDVSVPAAASPPPRGAPAPSPDGTPYGAYDDYGVIGGLSGSAVPKSVGGAVPPAAGGSATPVATDADTTGGVRAAARPDELARTNGGPAPLALVSLMLLATGLGLLALRLVARRIGG